MRRPAVVVVGAGAFGGWTALELRRRGAAVTLIDARGPGHARASSGGESRVIRAGYGSRLHYTAMALRAAALWRRHDADWRHRFFHPTGVLWLFGDDSAFAEASTAALRECGAPFEQLTPGEAARRYPQIRFDGISLVLLERDAGYLLARRACEHVVERFVAAGGSYRIAAAAPVDVHGARLQRLPLHGGGRLEADAFVFACGPWLPSVLPGAIGGRITVTRQDVHYFGPPPGDPSYTTERLPVWIDMSLGQIYGVPGDAHRGFKVADDATGPPFDPTGGDRTPDAASMASARRFLARRFPALAAAPYVGSEVCQYESTPDAGFILDRHPAADNVWIAGGGSGHGFKMGPAVGETMAGLVLGEIEPDPRYGLARFAARPDHSSSRWA